MSQGATCHMNEGSEQTGGRTRCPTVRRSQSYAPTHFAALLQRERPAWARDMKRSRDEPTDTSPPVRRTDATLKRRRVEDVERLRDQSSDLQVRIERFRWVAREAAAKAQKLNASSAATLRVRSRVQRPRVNVFPVQSSFVVDSSSSSSAVRLPERTWPSSLSLRPTPSGSIIRAASSPLKSCIASPSPRRKRQQSQDEEIILSPAPMSPQPMPDLRKTESKHNLSLGDFIAAIPGDQRSGTLRRNRTGMATPSSEKKRTASPAKLSPLRCIDEVKNDSEPLAVNKDEIAVSSDLQSQLALSGHNHAKDYAEMVALAAGTTAEVEADAEIDADEVQMKKKHRISKHDEALLKREGVKRDFVSKRAKSKLPTAAATEVALKGKKRKSTFFTILKGKNKKQKREETDNHDEAIDQEKLKQRVEYVKKKIEERYGIVRRTSRRNGRRVRIQDPSAASSSSPATSDSQERVAQDQPANEKADEAQQIDSKTSPDAIRQAAESAEGPVIEQTSTDVLPSTTATTITSSGTVMLGGRRRMAVTLDALANNNAIAIPKKTLVKQHGFIILDKENIPNCSLYQSPAKSPAKLHQSASSQTKRKRQAADTENQQRASGSVIVKSSPAAASPIALSSSAGGRGVHVQRRPLQVRNA